MRCRAGDLAVVVRDRHCHGVLGRFLTVLKTAPLVTFRLPDGYMHEGAEPGEWVVEFQQPVRVQLEGGGTRLTRFACAADSVLRPIRPQDGEDETIGWAGKPAPLEVVQSSISEREEA